MKSRDAWQAGGRQEAARRWPGDGRTGTNTGTAGGTDVQGNWRNDRLTDQQDVRHSHPVRGASEANELSWR